MMRLRDVSTIDARVLTEAVREILAVQRRMANKAKYIPDLRTHRSFDPTNPPG
jgi:CBS domain-containing protein